MLNNLRTNLKGYWELGEASGTRADRSGNGNNLTDNNTVTQMAGKVGNAALFTEANLESLSVANNPSLAVGDNSSITLAGWIYRATGSHSRSTIISKDNGVDGEFSFQYHNADNSLYLVIISATGGFTDVLDFSSTLVVVPLTTWTFVCACIDVVAETAQLQVNNTVGYSQAYSATNTRHDTSTPLIFGVDDNGGSPIDYFDGGLNQFGYWGRALSIEERTWLFNNNNGRSWIDIAALQAAPSRSHGVTAF